MPKRDRKTTLLREMWRREDGVIAVIVTIFLGVFMLVAGLVIDIGIGYTTRTQLQAAADSAALAGASLLNEDDATVIAEANEFAELNMPAARFGDVLPDADVEIGNWDNTNRIFTAGDTPRNAVRVTTRRTGATGNPVNTFFAKVAGLTTLNVSMPAVAVNGSDEDHLNCLHAMNPTDSKAFHIHGTADIQAVGCDIQVDSCADDGFYANGTPGLVLADTSEASGDAGKIYVCGGVDTAGPVSLPEYEEGADEVGDPFARLDQDDNGFPDYDNGPGSCDYTNYTATAGDTLYPGTYCGGITLTGSGSVNFASDGAGSGTYYIKDGPFDVAGTVAVSGTDVTFVMTGADANLDFKGTSDVGLSASTSGPYAGFIFWGDRRDGYEATDPHVMRGTPLGGINGVTYLPNADYELKGTADGTLAPGMDDCSVVIADTIYMNGTVGMEVDAECSAFADAAAFNGGTLVLRLVD